LGSHIIEEDISLSTGDGEGSRKAVKAVGKANNGEASFQSATSISI
jgi:hypothetical protein